MLRFGVKHDANGIFHRNSYMTSVNLCCLLAVHRTTLTSSIRALGCFWWHKRHKRHEMDHREWWLFLHDRGCCLFYHLEELRLSVDRRLGLFSRSLLRIPRRLPSIVKPRETRIGWCRGRFNCLSELLIARAAACLSHSSFDFLHISSICSCANVIAVLAPWLPCLRQSNSPLVL